jgi:uncharacterized membrane protein YdjX (TVP38/TMEM64 family)
MTRRSLLALGAVVLIILAAVLLHGAISLDDLKRNFAVVAAWKERSPVEVAVGLFLGYALVATLPLPFAAILTIASGAIFGVIEGTVLVSFSSSIAATGAFLASRYLFRDSVQSRFGQRLEVINRGVERDGVFYLFTLRLIPVFPFFLVNLLMGLAPIKARTFYWVSQLGMLPLAIIYVNAGTQLARLQHVGDVMSPALLASLALLAVFPWLAKLVIGFWRRQRAGRPKENHSTAP